MANIERPRLDVPLFEVVEHIVGNLGPPAYVREQDQDDPDWDTIVEDEATKEAWDRALADLIKAVKAGDLKVSGRASESEDLKELRAGDFPTKAANPFAGLLDLEVENSGERILEFYDGGIAKIVASGGGFGGFRVLQTDLRADSWDEVLKLWPSGTRRGLELADAELDEVILGIVQREGRVPSQNECAGIVRVDYPQVPRDRVRNRVAHLFPDLKQGRGSRKKCAK
jgi:hypothetical protein